uniref:Uncharacterized protein n=1 Tax=Arundo donax TaxID=35708 RepID=A0A0A8ZPP8_ARUDO
MLLNPKFMGYTCIRHCTQSTIKNRIVSSKYDQRELIKLN